MTSGPVQQGSDEWLAQRRGKITGSRIGAVLGLNPYQSREDVMRDMVREWWGAESEFQGNEATDWGTFMEPAARAFYENLKGVSVFETDSVEHPEHEFLAASPDGIVGFEGSAEFKCPYYARRPYTLDQKAYYRAQIQLCLACCQLEWCDFLVYYDPETYKGPGEHYHLEREHRDPEWLDANMPVLKEFYEEFLVYAGSKRKSAKFLRDASEKSAEPILDDPRLEELERLLSEQKELKAQLAPVTTRISILREAVIEEHGSCTNGRVRVMRVEKRGQVDYQGVVEAISEVPEIKASIGDLDSWRKDTTYAFKASLIDKKEAK